MKRRQRRPVLDISGEQSESPRRRWQNKYQQIAVDHPEQNGVQINPLTNLLGQYNSDSETEDTKQDSTKLNDQVNDFLKEIQLIAPEPPKQNVPTKSEEPGIPVEQATSHHNLPPTCLWQECFDESTGYPYYWHMETNEVTWEMPAEMRLFKDSTCQESQIHVHPAHAQVQWANFPPNTYPQMQTNIPEGMIPKEVVARNRNRQVGFMQSQKQEEQAEQNTPRKPGYVDDDLDEGKIEMITSFGDDESESDASDNESLVEEKPKETSAVKVNLKAQNPSISPSVSTKSEDVDMNVTIGPSLPPGIVPMIHGPENASIDIRNIIDCIRNKNKKEIEKNLSENSESQCALSSLSSYEDPSSPKGVLKTDDIDEEDILRRLKNQARVLQSLGGEVPESVESLIQDESADNIISQIEKETPLDHEQCSKPSEDQSESVEGNKSEEKMPSLDTNKLESPGMELKFSLVAGYGEDSDAEDEVSPKKAAAKPLFPISEFEEEKSSTSLQANVSVTSENSGTPNENAVVSSDGPVRKMEFKQTENGSIRIFDYQVDRKEKAGVEHEEAEEFDQADAERPEDSEAEETRVVTMESEPPKPNIFLENMEVPSKAFQRKKRIAFDVVPTKSKPVEPQTIPPTKPDAASLTFTTTSSGDVEHCGFGFQKEPSNEDDHHLLLDVPKEKSEKPSVQVKKGGINFVKGTTINTKVEEKTKSEEMPDTSKKKELKLSTDIVMEKLKFLSEGSQIVSAIQVMAIQLQTLLGAWEAGDLKQGYLADWLEGICCELARLEQAAAPPGWDCQWDRSHKRYYYRNTTSGEAQWTYPQADIVGGTEEMDLCTTPPPPDHEEPCIIEQAEIEVQQSAASSSKEKTMTTDDKTTESTKTNAKDIEAPPPPQISSPSPPPPPRIFAKDLKKGKKRRGSTNGKSSESKKDRKEKEKTPTPDAKSTVNPPLPPTPPQSSQPPLPPQPPLTPNPPNSEPLPPGVDPPELPYTMSASTIDPNVVYTATSQQTNPIYAATIGDPVVHAAMMQGQLMNYPAYHQHLHSHAMIAAASSLTSPDAVQFMMTDFSPVYANSQVIAKPPVKSQRESLGSALDSFYNDIASIEKTNTEQDTKPLEATSMEATVTPMLPVQAEAEQVSSPADPSAKEKKKKKAKVGVGKKHKEMTNMVAKWQKAQKDFGDSD